MQNLKRISLQPLSGIPSSYKKRYKKEYWDVEVFNNKGQMGNYMTQFAIEALHRLNRQIIINKGKLRITDLFRSWEVQAKNRNDYLTGKKRAYVAKPGSSFHNSGRSVDIAIEMLEFEGLKRDDWLEYLWDIAIPLGFKPIIKIPDMDASEAWHFDIPGEDWLDAYNNLSYGEVAKCCALDVGMWDPSEDAEKVKNMFIQSQLIRLGHYEIGKVDGIIGSKTKRVLWNRDWSSDDVLRWFSDS